MRFDQAHVLEFYLLPTCVDGFVMAKGDKLYVDRLVQHPKVLLQRAEEVAEAVVRHCDGLDLRHGHAQLQHPRQQVLVAAIVKPPAPHELDLSYEAAIFVFEHMAEGNGGGCSAAAEANCGVLQELHDCFIRDLTIYSKDRRVEAAVSQ